MLSYEVIQELAKVGLYPRLPEVILAVADAIVRIWEEGELVEVPALTVIVEDTLFASDMYMEALSGINLYIDGH